MISLLGLLLWALLHGSAATPPTPTTPPTTTAPAVVTSTPAPVAPVAVPATSPASTPATPATPAPVASAAGPAQITVAAKPITAPLPDGFVGLSLEYSTPPQWSSDGGRTPSPVLVQLIKNLDPGGRPVIRIGGASAERTWWPVRGMSRPPGVTYTLNQQWMRSVKTLAQATDARLLLGIDMAADKAAVVHAEAEAFLRDIGRHSIEALEVGNEPEFYSRVDWYRRDGGRSVPWYSKVGTPVYARPADYDPARWATDYAALLRAVPDVEIAGPDSGTLDYLKEFARFLTPGSRVRMMTSHAYALTNCQQDAAIASYPSVAHLLTQAASRSFAIAQAPYIAFAHSRGAGFRVDEMGSVSCNGKAGVSNTMASALWLTDALMSIAAAGADGVNLHTFPREINNLFDLHHSDGQWSGVVHPLYYGALLFTQAAPTGSRLLKIQMSGPTTLRPWATLGRDGALRVLFINDALSGSASTRLVVPAAFAASPASAVSLTAASAYATDGLSLGGASFGSQTATGALPPTTPQVIEPSSGAYTVTLPAASATLLTLHPTS